jgi:hypothetical protein
MSESVEAPDASYIGYRLEAFAGVYIPLQIIFVGLRLYARRLTGRKYDYEDWLVIAAMVANLLQASLIIGT